MKTGNLQLSLLAIAAITTLSIPAGNVAAQEPTTVAQPAAAVQPPAASQPAPQFSYGVPQVLQLVQAKVSDGIIVNYIQNSGTIYSLSVGEIVYLKQQGVSDNVLNSMLNQRSRLTGSTEPVSSPAPSANASYAPPASATPPVATYAAPAQSSTVYIIPDTQTYRYNNWYYGGYPYNYGYPYSGAYYGWPAVSLSFGWGSYNYNGGSYHYNGYHGGGGGYHGGGGGGYHGGGGGGGYHGGGGGGGYHGGGGGGGGHH